MSEDEVIQVRVHVVNTAPSSPEPAFDQTASNPTSLVNGTHINGNSAPDVAVAAIQAEEDTDGDVLAGRKRKFSSLTKSGRSSRVTSPPWKKAAVDGPTSFVVDGKRKSARTNTVPIELQPASEGRKTRAAQNRGKPRPSYAALNNGIFREKTP